MTVGGGLISLRSVKISCRDNSDDIGDNFGDGYTCNACLSFGHFIIAPKASAEGACILGEMGYY